MQENLEKVKLQARDLRNGTEFPRSPRAILGGYVLPPAPWTSVGRSSPGGRENTTPTAPSIQRWLKFAEIDYDRDWSFIATGATDEEVSTWIGRNASKSLGRI